MIAFFIRRPIFAAVLSIAMAVLGAVAVLQLPVARFPVIAPPVVQVVATYTGGSAQAVADTVTRPLEQAINGVDGLIHIASTSSNDGRTTIRATFEVGYDVDIAAMDVMNRVNQARPRLPQSVLDLGITVEKSSPQLAAVVSLSARDGRYDTLFLSNYADINLVDRLNRLPGVGSIQNFSRQTYAIRVWLDPARMEHLGIAPREVIEAIRAQNAPVAAGAIGEAPVPGGQAFALQVQAPRRLDDARGFEEIVVRTGPDGSAVRLGNLGRVEFAAERYGSDARFSGAPSAQLGIFQSPGANAIDVIAAIEEELDRASARFPDGVEWAIPFSTATFVQASIEEVAITLLIAITLVVGTVYLFLQDWRATLIPCLTIPVALVGTFAVMVPIGFSINTLSLLGLVLAVGLVVDDAIVVVENVTRNLEEGKEPRAAARAAMAEVAGPVVATTLVLVALFVPVAFIPGLTGQLYNQFALTVAIAVVLSSVMALTLAPALAAVLLRPRRGARNRVFQAFNHGFERAARAYERIVGRLVALWVPVVGLFAVLMVATVVLFLQRPTAFVPQEDQGFLFVNVQLPEAASLQRTRAVVGEIEGILRAEAAVADTIAISGFSLIANASASYFGLLIPSLKPWAEREEPVSAFVERMNRRLAAYPHARVRIINPPALPGIGAGGGLTLEIQALENQPPERLQAVARRFLGAANGLPEVRQAFTTFSADVPQLRLEIDRTRVEQYGVGLRRLYATVQAYLGSAFVNEFTRFGRTYRVFVQAEGAARDRPEDIHRLSVLNADGDRVPLGVLVDVAFGTGPQSIAHYNLYPAVSVLAQPAEGASSGQVVAALEALAARTLPAGFGYEWTGSVYQQKQAGNLAPIIFALAVLLVYLVLAAQYESWAVPVAILLAVPLAVLGALALLLVRGMPLDVFAQIGLLMLVGLAAKNSILLVAFANDARRDGAGPLDAARAASRLRLRPILMTALSFVLGVMPLVFASGAGANARMSLGTTVVGGMLVATVLTLFVTPVFYVLLERWRGTRRAQGTDAVPDRRGRDAAAE